MCCEIVWGNSVDLNLFCGQTCCNLASNFDDRIRSEIPEKAFQERCRKSPGYIHNSSWILDQRCLFHPQKWYFDVDISLPFHLYISTKWIHVIWSTLKAFYDFIFCVPISQLRNRIFTNTVSEFAIDVFLNLPYDDESASSSSVHRRQQIHALPYTSHMKIKQRIEIYEDNLHRRCWC